MEKSLIIIKPDLEKNLVGKEKLINLISGSGLTVYDTSQIVFNNWMIENMWPQFQSDVISISNRLLIVTPGITSVKFFVLFGNNFKLNKDFKLKTSNKKAQCKEATLTLSFFFILVIFTLTV
ncbi:hypothetical protein, partial [Streptococcus sanguinis]|uniref:hypothetical protein n=1 Tax=Streptococcus sanguinis TaxID=1305 RepID=UPI001D1450E3